MSGSALAFSRGLPICGLLTLFVNGSLVNGSLKASPESDGRDFDDIGMNTGPGQTGCRHHQPAKVL